MKILILAHFYPPEMGGAAARLHGLSRWLAAFGHDVTVVTGMPSYPSGIVADDYRRKWRVREQLDGVNLIRVRTYTTPKRGSLRRLANFLSFVVSGGLTALFMRGKYDLIMASAPPLFLGIAGAFVGVLRRLPFIFDIRDIWPEVAVEAGEFAPDSLIVRLGERLERFLYRRATHITPVTEAKRQNILGKGVPPAKLSVVPNGVDLDFLQAAPNSDIRRDLNIGDRFLVTYAGLLGVFQGVNIAVEAADLLRERDDIHFLIVGDGPKRTDLEAQVADLKLDNVSFVPRQPREAIPGILRASDVSLVPLVTEKLLDAVPSKLLEAWGCRKPVILVAGGAARKLLQEADGGLVVKPGQPQQLAQAVIALADDRAKGERFAEQGFSFVSTHLDRPLLARQMEKMMKSIIM